MPAKLQRAARYVEQMSVPGDVRLILATLRRLWSG
jgi:lipopolysaccharide/colanic/teichoic acid biosynthesis glycosyltransferase